jgi:hypothetical protein
LSPQHLAAPASTTHVLVAPAEIELCVSPISPVDPVSFESALATFVVRPKIPNRATTTAAPMKLDFLESFLSLENLDTIWPFIKMKFA